MSPDFYFYLLNTFAYKNVLKVFSRPTNQKQTKAATGGQIKLKIDNV